MPKNSQKTKTAGDQRLERWTDKSNAYENMDPTEHEPPNSVFPSRNKVSKRGKGQKK